MRPKHEHRAGLPSAVVYLLVHGALPPDGHPARDAGLVEAFNLKYSATLGFALRQLWSQHADEITAATPEGVAPWIAVALRSPGPEEDDDQDEDGDQDEGDDEDTRTDP